MAANKANGAAGTSGATGRGERPASRSAGWLRSACLPPSRLGHTSKLDGARLGVGSTLAGTLSAPVAVRAAKVAKATILVTGGDGQLGRCLREIERQWAGYKFVFTDVGELDITDRAAVRAAVAEHKPAWVINAAAYTAVDKAEGEEELARKINALAVENLALESAAAGAGLVHISTDYVFPGDDPHPLKEDAPTGPRSAYGRTKLEGEAKAALNPRNIVIRTSWLYSIYGNNFVRTMLRLGVEKRQVEVVADQWGSPTSAYDLAGAVMAAIAKPSYGIFHYCDKGAATWALFAEEIMALAGLECKVNHITTAESPAAAQRPAFSILDTHRFEAAFGVRIPEWEMSLEEVVNKLKGE